MELAKKVLYLSNQLFAISIVFTHIGGYVTGVLGFLFAVPRLNKIIKNNIFKTITLFIVYGLLISTFSNKPSLGYFVILNYFSHWMLPFVLGYFLMEQKHVEKVFWHFYCIFFFLFAFSMIAYFGFFWKSIGNFYLVEEGLLKGLRHHIGYAAMLSIISFISFSFGIFSDSDNKRKYLFILFGFLFLIGIILTGSRGYYIAIFISAVIFLLWISLRNKKILPAFLFLVFFMMVSFLVYKKAPQVQNRIKSAFSGKDESVIERILLSKVALNIIKDYPLFGVGPGQSPYQKKYFDMEKMNFYNAQGHPRHIHMHSFYLNLLADFGITGFLIFIILFFQIFSVLYTIFKKSNGFPKALSTGLMFGIIAIFVGEFFDTHLRGPGVALELFWLVGLLCGFKDEN